MKRFAEVPAVYMERTEPAFAIGSGRTFGPFYAGSWEFLIIKVEASSAVNSAMFVDVAWSLNETPGAETYADNLNIYCTPTQGAGFWCLPVRGIYCYITVSSPAGVPAYRMNARFSNVYVPHPGTTMIGRTTPATTGVITDTYALYSTIGRAKLNGYCYNNLTASFAIIAIQEQENVTGNWNTIYYNQTPNNSPANFVQIFDLEIPLSGRALRVRENTGGGGANNSFIWLQPYAHWGA